METKKHLIPMTDFVLEQSNEAYSMQQFVNRVESYANFLKQPLQLEMFVPCDDYGNVLEEPKTTTIQEANFNIDEIENWNKAKKKVLFEGFKWDYEDACLKYQLSNGGIWFFGLDDLENENIETFGGIENEIELTETAIKQIYGC